MGIIIRQTIKGTIVNYVGIAIGFFTTFFVLTQFLTAEEIGLTRVLVDAAILLSGLAQLGTSSSVIRYYPYFKNEKHKDHGFFFWSLVVPFIGFLIFGTLYLILEVPIENIFSEKSPLFVDYYYFVLPLTFFMLYLAVFETNANVLMRIVVPKLVREVVVRVLALVVYLVYAFKLLSLDGFVIAFCSVYAVATLINIIYLFSLNRISLKPDFKYITKSLRKDYLLYTLFLIAAALGGAITPSINTFFISAQMGLNYTGIFAIATFIAAIIEIPYRSLGAITQPQISQTVKDGDMKGADLLCKSVSLHQLLASSFIFLIIWINIDLFFAVLPNGTEYSEAKWVVFILGLSKLINSTFSVGISVLSYSKYYYLSLVFTFILTATAIILNNLFIPIWGMNGAAAASLIAYIIYFGLLLSLVKWKIKTSPFSPKQLKILVITLGLFIVNCVWTAYITPHFLAIAPSLTWQIAEAVLRTTILCVAGITAVYYWGISSEVEHLLQLAWSKHNIIKRTKKL